MTDIEIPTRLRPLAYLAGSAWPGPPASEAGMSRLAQSLQVAADGWQALIPELARVRGETRTVLDGQTATAVDHNFHLLFDGPYAVATLVGALRALGNLAARFASQLQYLKLQIISTLAVAASTIGWALANAEWSGGASLSQIAIAERMASAAIEELASTVGARLQVALAQALSRTMVRRLVADAVLSAGLGAVQESGIEAYQAWTGYREDISPATLVDSAVSMGLAGLTGAVVGHLAAAGLGPATDLVTRVSKGALSGLAAAEAANAVASGGQVTPMTLLAGAIGFIHGAVPGRGEPANSVPGAPVPDPAAAPPASFGAIEAHPTLRFERQPDGSFAWPGQLTAEDAHTDTASAGASRDYTGSPRTPATDASAHGERASGPMSPASHAGGDTLEHATTGPGPLYQSEASSAATPRPHPPASAPAWRTDPDITPRVPVEGTLDLPVTGPADPTTAVPGLDSPPVASPPVTISASSLTQTPLHSSPRLLTSAGQTSGVEPSGPTAITPAGLADHSPARAPSPQPAGMPAARSLDTTVAHAAAVQDRTESAARPEAGARLPGQADNAAAPQHSADLASGRRDPRPGSFRRHLHTGLHGRPGNSREEHLARPGQPRHDPAGPPGKPGGLRSGVARPMADPPQPVNAGHGAQDGERAVQRQGEDPSAGTQRQPAVGGHGRQSGTTDGQNGAHRSPGIGGGAGHRGGGGAGRDGTGDHDGSDSDDQDPVSPDAGGDADAVGAPGAVSPAGLLAASAFRDELIDAARVASDSTGKSVSVLIEQFVLQGVLSRVFAANPNDWMLKGGLAMQLRIPDARPSSDIDLVGLSGADLDTMKADYAAALGRDHGDHLRFEFESELIPATRNCVTRNYRAYIGDMEVMRVSADLNSMRTLPLWGEPQIVGFPDRILQVSDAEPDIRIMSAQDTLAHKISGIFLHGYPTPEPRCLDCQPFADGMWRCREIMNVLPYRPQDLADVLLLALHVPFDGAATQNMLRQEFDFRRASGSVLVVPEHFEVPNPNWKAWFSDRLSWIGALPFSSLSEALPLARDFLDPLLQREALRGRWDPAQRRWTAEGDQSAQGYRSGENLDDRGALAAQGVSVVGATGRAEASAVTVDPEQAAEWDRLTAGFDMPGSEGINAYRDQLVADDSLPVAGKVEALAAKLSGIGYEAQPVTSLDDKHLRIYAHQNGEVPIHAAALIVDPETTIEIVFQPYREFFAARMEAYQAHIAYLEQPPVGMTAAQANAVVFSRWLRGMSIHDVAPDELVRGLLDLHTEPLRKALQTRQRLMSDYHISPARIRIAHVTSDTSDFTYASSRWLRSHLFTLSRIRERPLETRAAIVEALRGQGAVAHLRMAHVSAVMDRLFAVHENGDTNGGRKYVLLWVRDTRPLMRSAQMDTRPQFLRQIIELLRDKQPDRQIMLAGDDLFANRPQLYEWWVREGALDGVDTRTLVKFWEPDRNGGSRLTRAEQALFFYRLATERDVVQIGMESGALELPAVLGLPTAYLSERQYEGNKARRWLHYSTPWQYGLTTPLTDDRGNQLYDPDSGAPAQQFRRHGELLAAPLNTVERVPVGEDFPDPTDRRQHPVAVFRPARVSLTHQRMVSLIASGELDRWTNRLGRSVGLQSDEWQPWTDRDWQTSARYADQLSRWLHVRASSAADVATKWDAIRLALKGVVEPGYGADEIYPGPSTLHPYFTIHSPHAAPPHIANRIARAYTAHPAVRPAAVVDALRDLFRRVDIDTGAMHDLAAFRLDGSELRDLHAVIDRVVSRNTIHPVAPYEAPPDGCAWDAPGAATHSMRPPLDRLWVPENSRSYILDGNSDGTSGGHRHGTGMPGKSEFPARWDDDTVIRYLIEIATAPRRARYQAHGRWQVVGERDSVTVSVIVLPDGRIWSAYPQHGRGVIQNPRG